MEDEPMATMERKERRWKVLWLDMDLVISLFNGFRDQKYLHLPVFEKLPKDVRFIDAQYSWERRQLGIRIEHESFEPVQDGERAPSVGYDLQYMGIETINATEVPGLKVRNLKRDDNELQRLHDTVHRLEKENAELRAKIEQEIAGLKAQFEKMGDGKVECVPHTMTFSKSSIKDIVTRTIEAQQRQAMLEREELLKNSAVPLAFNDAGAQLGQYVLTELPEDAPQLVVNQIVRNDKGVYGIVARPVHNREAMLVITHREPVTTPPSFQCSSCKISGDNPALFCAFNGVTTLCLPCNQRMDKSPLQFVEVTEAEKRFRDMLAKEEASKKRWTDDTSGKLVVGVDPAAPEGDRTVKEVFFTCTCGCKINLTLNPDAKACLGCGKAIIEIKPSRFVKLELPSQRRFTETFDVEPTNSRAQASFVCGRCKLRTQGLPADTIHVPGEKFLMLCQPCLEITKTVPLDQRKDLPWLQ